MKHQVKLNWAGKMAFDAAVGNHQVRIDADESSGGEDSGVRPKMLTLASLGGCTGMDVVSILKKMKEEPESLNIEINGELTEEHPKYYKNIHIRYIFTGKDLDRDKLAKAIELSQEKYCGVTAMLKHAANITYEIAIL